MVRTSIFSFTAVVLGLLIHVLPAAAQTRLSVGTGFMVVDDTPGGFMPIGSPDIGMIFSMDQGSSAHAVRVAHRIHPRGEVELSYVLAPTTIRTGVVVFPQEWGQPLIDDRLASSDTFVHVMRLGYARTLIEDSESGRSFGISGAIGFIVLDPGTNRTSSSNEALPPEEIPRDLGVTTDPLLGVGARFRFPVPLGSTAVRIDLAQDFQLCGEEDSLRYACGGSETEYRTHGTLGVEFVL